MIFGRRARDKAGRGVLLPPLGGGIVSNRFVHSDMSRRAARVHLAATGWDCRTLDLLLTGVVPPVIRNLDERIHIVEGR